MGFEGGLDRADYDADLYNDPDDPMTEEESDVLDDLTRGRFAANDSLDDIESGLQNQQLSLAHRIETAMPPLLGLQDRRKLLEAVYKPNLNPKKIAALGKKVEKTIQQSYQVMNDYRAALFSPQAEAVFPHQQLEQIWADFCTKTVDLKTRKMWLKSFPNMLATEQSWKKELSKEPEAVQKEYEILHEQQSMVDRRLVLEMVKADYDRLFKEYNRELTKQKKNFSPKSLEEFDQWFKGLKTFTEMHAALRDLPREVAKRQRLTEEFEKLSPEVQEEYRETFMKLSRHEKATLLRSLREKEKDPLTMEYTNKLMKCPDYSEKEKVMAVRRYRALSREEKQAILVLLPGRMRYRAGLSQQFEKLSPEVRAKNSDFYKLSKMEKIMRLRFLTQAGNLQMQTANDPYYLQRGVVQGAARYGNVISLEQHRRRLEKELAGEKRAKALQAINSVTNTAEGQVVHLLGEVLDELRAEESRRGIGADMTMKSRIEASVLPLHGRKKTLAKAYMQEQESANNPVIFNQATGRMEALKILKTGAQSPESDVAQNVLQMRRKVALQRGARERGQAPAVGFSLRRHADGQERATTQEMAKDIHVQEMALWQKMVPRLVEAGVVIKGAKQEDVAEILYKLYAPQKKQEMRQQAA